MNTLSVKIDSDVDELDLPKIKYAFNTIANIFKLKIIYKGYKADILYGEQKNEKCKLFIQYDKYNFKKYLKSDIADVIYDRDIPFIFFYNTNRFNIIEGKEIRNDIIFTIFWLLTGCAEKYIPRDNKDRHLILQSSLYKKGLLHKPLVNIYAYLIRNLLDLPRYKYIWGEKEFGFALTHDVDYPEEIKWIEFIRYVLRNPFKFYL